MKHELHSFQSKAISTTFFFSFISISLVVITIINDIVIIIMTIIVVVLRVKNVFLYIVIKKSCWTVTYSFESGLILYMWGQWMGKGAMYSWNLIVFFFFLPWIHFKWK